jgi:predicted nucleotidyltransferase component of viral defense system
MLHPDTIQPYTKSLLDRLSRQGELSGFKLVGGTALSLQVGHRISTDLDIFINTDFDVDPIAKLFDTYAEVSIYAKKKNLLQIFVGGVKVDFACHKYGWLKQGIRYNNIFIASIDDIVAMKLGAILSRAKKRDFIDLAALLTIRPLNQILEAFISKYKQRTTLHVIRAMNYFVDAEEDKEPLKILDDRFTWEKSKMIINNAIRSLNKNRGGSMGPTKQ